MFSALPMLSAEPMVSTGHMLTSPVLFLYCTNNFPSAVLSAEPMLRAGPMLRAEPMV